MKVCHLTACLFALVPLAAGAQTTVSTPAEYQAAVTDPAVTHMIVQPGSDIVLTNNSTDIRTGNLILEGVLDANGDVPMLRGDGMAIRRALKTNGAGTYMFENMRFENFSTDGDPSGGALHFAINSTSTVDMKNVHFYGNSARFDGGGFIAGTFVGNIVDSTFIENKAGAPWNDGSGGAFSTFLDMYGDIRNVVFARNHATHHGGAFSLRGAIYGDIVNTQFIDNIAAERSSGAFGTNYGMVGTLKDSVLLRNTARSRGGAIYMCCAAAGFKIDDTRFEGNISKFSGGALAIFGEGVSIQNSLFTDNQAEGETDYWVPTTTIPKGVGGAGVIGGSFAVHNSTFLGNKAVHKGAAFHHIHDVSDPGIVVISAGGGGQTLFYGNWESDTNRYTSLYFSLRSSSPLATNQLDIISAAGSSVVMLDAMDSAPDPLLTVNVDKTGAGDWFLGGASQMQAKGDWAINDGALNLVTMDYDGSGDVGAEINLHEPTATFTLGNAAMLSGQGKIKASTITLDGTIAPDKWVNTGTLAPDLLAKIATITNDVTNAESSVNADGAIADAHKLATINAQIRQQVNALVDISDATADGGSQFGTLSLDGNVSMNGAIYNVDLDYNGGTPVGDLIDINGSLTTTGTNIINVSGLSYTDPIVAVNATGITQGAVNDMDHFASVIKTTGGISGTDFELRIGNQAVNQVDYAQVFGKRVNGGTEYGVGLGLSWYSTVKDAAGTDKAHGTFTLTNASSLFTLNGVLTNRTDTDGVNWDGQSLTKKGAGTLVLNGANTYTGLTDVQAGTLMLGDLSHSGAGVAGGVQVASGALLTGTGTAAGNADIWGRLQGTGMIRGQVNMHAGSAVAPGFSIGTITTGELNQTAGSTYEVEIDETGASDLIKVEVLGGSSGTATIDNGAALTILNAGSNNPIDWAWSTVYTIIETENGVTGTFGAVNNTLAFLDHYVDYANPKLVQLRMDRKAFANFCGTLIQCAVGGGLDDLVNTAPGNPILGIVLGLHTDEVAAAYKNLSGEIYASSRSAILLDRQLRDAVTRRMLGLNNIPEGRHLWVDTWGHKGRIRGDSHVAQIDTSGLGLALGLDRQFTPDFLAGAFFAYEDNKIKNAHPRSSRSDIDAYSVGAYMAANADRFVLRGGLSYSALTLDTRREISVGRLQGRATSKARGSKVQAFAEVARPLAVGERSTVSPYANLTQVWLRTNGAYESGNAAALTVARQRDNLRFSTVGMRAALNLARDTATQLTLAAAWMHVFGTQRSQTTHRFAGQGAGFVVQGVGLSRNTALLGAGLHAQLSQRTTLRMSYQAQLGGNVRQHTGQVQLRIAF